MGLVVKPNTFTAGATIVASEHNSNFDTIYNSYNGNIENANIKSDAAIVGSKLNLAEAGAIGGTTPAAGAFTTLSASGALTANGAVTLGNASGDDITITGSIAASIPLKAENVDIGTTSIGLNDLHFGSGGIINWDGGDVTLTHSAGKLTLGGDGAVEIDFATHEMTNVDINSGTLGAITIDGNWTAASQTCADLGAVTTCDINGGTIDGTTISSSSVEIPGTPATGELVIADASDDIDGLGSQGTSGQILTSAGAGSVPTWGDAGMKLISTTTSTGVTVTSDITIAASKNYLVTFSVLVATGGNTSVRMRFSQSGGAVGSGYHWAGTGIGTGVAEANGGAANDADIGLAEEGEYVDELVATNGWMKGQFFIDTNKVGSAYSAFVNGSFMALDENGVVVW